MAKCPKFLSTLCGSRFDELLIARSADTEPISSGWTSIRLTATNGAGLPAGRYFLYVMAPAGKISVQTININVGEAEWVPPVRLEPRSGPTRAAIVLMQDAPYLVVSAEAGADVLFGMSWRLRCKGYATFYGGLSLRHGWRLFAGKERWTMLREAIRRNGVGGFGSAVRGDWDAALAPPRSGFTARQLDYPEAAGLATRPAVATPGLAIVGDFSLGAELPEIDDALLKCARMAGLAALCLPCVWQDGQLRFSASVQRFLDDPALDFPFFFRRTGRQATGFDEGKERAFIEAISPWFDDPRYLRAGDKAVMAMPVHSDALEGGSVVTAWRAAEGGEIFVLATTSAGDASALLSDCDVCCVPMLAAKGGVSSTSAAERNYNGLPDTPPAKFGRAAHAAMAAALRGVARPGALSYLFVELSPANVGPSLNQDSCFGYAWIEALRVAQARCAATSIRRPHRLRAAVVVHAFYPEVFVEILETLKDVPAEHKLFVTTTASGKDEIEKILGAAGLDYVLRVFDNRGRDILPFMKIYDEVVAGGFDIVAKIHTKKSRHRRDGENWRRTMVDPMFDHGGFERIFAAFDCDTSLGMIGPDAHLVSLRTNIVANEARVFGLARRLGLSEADVKRGSFFAGSMFVARVSALAPLMSLAIDDGDFESEARQLDGTLAHAIERGFALSVISSDMRVAGLEDEVRRHSIWWAMSG